MIYAIKLFNQLSFRFNFIKLLMMVKFLTILMSDYNENFAIGVYNLHQKMACIIDNILQ